MAAIGVGRHQKTPTPGDYGHADWAKVTKPENNNSSIAEPIEFACCVSCVGHFRW